MTSPRPHPFTLRQLQYAVAVAETLSFRRAAERCHVSQPALSAQIALMEAALGTRLFERDRRRVLPTGAGRAVLKRAGAVLREADDLAEAARRAGDPLAGTLRLGVIPTLSPYLLPRFMPRLRAAHPGLTVLWSEDRTGALMIALRAGDLDAALLALEADLGDVEHDVVGVDPFFLVTPRAHPLGAAATPARPRDLRGVPVLLLDDGHCLREQALAVCSRAGAREREFRATSLSTLAQMVAAGAGVTLLPATALPVELKRAEMDVRPFAAPAPARTIALVWRPRSPLADALRTLAATMRGAYPEEDPASGASRGTRGATPQGGRPRPPRGGPPRRAPGASGSRRRR